MDAFDADVLIYAAVAGHPLGRRVRALFDDRATVGIGSVLLLPEVLTKPRREEALEQLADACDVVLARPPRRLAGADARRLTARVRERGSVLVVAGAWPEAAEVQLAVASAAWEGLGPGHGRLLGRRVEVVAGGRGAAARERRVGLWLPHPEGGVRCIAPCTNGVEVVGEEVVGERRAHARRVVS